MAGFWTKLMAANPARGGLLIAVVSVAGMLGMGVAKPTAAQSPDTTAPRGAVYAPNQDTIQYQTVIKIYVQDPMPDGAEQSELNLRSFQLTVNGTDVTDQARFVNQEDFSQDFPVGPDIGDELVQSERGVLRYTLFDSPEVPIDEVDIVLTLSDVAGNRSTLTRSYQVDATDQSNPIGDLFSPVPDSNILDPLAPVKLWLVDPVRGNELNSKLNLVSFNLTVGGTDVTEAARFYHLHTYGQSFPVGEGARNGELETSERGDLIYRPTVDNPLPSGDVEVVLMMADVAGNATTISRTFSVGSSAEPDTTAPRGLLFSPSAGETVDDLAILKFYVQDPAHEEQVVSELNLVSLSVFVNDVDVTDAVSYYHEGDYSRSYPIGSGAIGSDLTKSLYGDIWYIPPDSQPYNPGENNARVELVDNEGLMTTINVTFSVEGDAVIRSLPRAIPASGAAPLPVQFIPGFEVNTAVELFEWDFDGDGVFDTSETVGRNQNYTYTSAGTFDAVLRITDSLGNQAIGTVVVTVGNTPPVVDASAMPSNGAIPLEVAFTVLASDNEGIGLYEWDFEGDGVYDYTSPSTGNTSFTYTQVGNFQPVVRVSDSLGVQTTKTLPTTEVRAAAEGSPSVELTANPVIGDVPLTVTFTATTQDPDGGTVTMWSWDYDGDGTFDADTATNTTSFNYQTPGTNFARVRVTVTDGDTAEDVVQVVVGADIDLSLSIDTLDTEAGETVTVSTVIGGTLVLGIDIEDEDGDVVRSLVTPTERPAGRYDDVWDGRDDAGDLLPDGVYYAVALYDIDGVTNRLDLRESTGGRQSSPRRSRIPSSFSPFAGDPLDITFTLNNAAEVTAFIGLFNVNTRLVTFYERATLGRGSHTIIWNGENADGQLVHPPGRDRFLFGIFEFSLADNAVVISNIAEVSALTAAPSIFVPDSTIPDSTLAFSLTKPADLELVIINAETGVELDRIIYTGGVEGANEFTWDGRVDNGLGGEIYVSPGRYRLGIAAIGAGGTRSTTVYTVQQVYY